MLEKLKVYYVGEKIRVGKDNDGGYVVPKIAIKESSALFSYGIQDDISFDEHYIELTDFKNKAYGYDHTIDSISTKYYDNFYLNKEGLSGEKTENTNNFIEHFNSKEISGKAFLKIDIEGGEYEFFNKTNVQHLSNIVTGMVVEFHDIDNDDFRKNFSDIIGQLNKHFTICHIHGNNCEGVFYYEEHKINCSFPEVIEITFLSKYLIENVELDNSTYPTSLDQKNRTDRDEIDLYFIKFINEIK